MVDLDFVIGQMIGYPIGMTRDSPAEFRRRVTAAGISYFLQLRSIDYALRRYVEPAMYEEMSVTCGDQTSDYLRNCSDVMVEELKLLHTTEELTFGIFAAEISLYRVPHALDTARMLANRGLLLEMLPILRLCLEMIAWGAAAFSLSDDEKIKALKAQRCVSQLKPVYATAGKLYGYLSRFTHWGFEVHREFLITEEDHVGVLNASVRYRAIGLSLCLVVLDVMMAVIRHLYPSECDRIMCRIQGEQLDDNNRNTAKHLADIVNLTDLEEIREIRQLMFS